MRVLHLFSNSKFTGPAEPALNLFAELKRQGVDAIFACRSTKAGNPTVTQKAREIGIEPEARFHLNKHFSFTENFSDLKKLTHFLLEHKVRIIHAHMNNDHLVGAIAAKHCIRNGVLVVRSCYDGSGPQLSLRNRYVYGRLTDGVITASSAARAKLETRFHLPLSRLWLAPAAVDLRRFSPSGVSRDMRSSFGFLSDDFVIGVVARIQPHRRYDVLLKSIQIAAERNPKIKLLIIGRGDNLERLLVRPLRERRIENRVVSPGYLSGQDYVDALACIDAKIFLVPGTDGTCRAVREAMAMGKPVIAARRGMLPEIVDHELNGLVVEDNPENLAEAICRLAKDNSLLRSMSQEALKKAQRDFDLPGQARRVIEVYEHLEKYGQSL